MKRQSLSLRFNVSAVAIVTVILIIFGVYDYSQTSSSLKAKLEQDVSFIEETLTLSVPASLWNFEFDQVSVVVNASIKNTNIQAILVTENGNVVTGVRKDESGTPVAIDSIESMLGSIRQTTLEYEESGSINEVGQLTLEINEDFLVQQQRTAITGSIVQIIVLAVFMAIALRMLVTKLVKQPINEVSDALADISSGEGDLTQRVSISRRDEIGQLGNYFNQFIEKIHESMRQVDSSSHKISDTVDSVNEIAKVNAQAVENTHQDTDQVATAINEMNATAQEVSNLAETVMNQANNADSETQKTVAVVQTTSDSIGQLSENIRSGTDVISSLKDDVNSIVSVLDTIRGIAEQTNLLALNAAIEAARAGEQGRGFAVVADEVRALAARTQDSTSEIQSMIEKLEAGSDSAVKVMTQSTEQSAETVTKVSEALASLATISDAVSEINGMSSQISNAVHEQKQVSEEINQNVTNIVSSIQETADGAKTNSESTEQLKEQSNLLVKMVSNFKL